jgi:HSP20 family protein
MALPTTRQRPSTPRPIQRWDPFRELEEVQERMGQLMESVWSGGDGDTQTRAWVPLVDVEETEDAWIVEADLPGAKTADIDVDVRDAELVVSGDIKERERKGLIRRRTRKTGEFELRMTLPGSADAEKVDADFDDGVLTVRIPKAEKSKPRRIEVRSNKGADG